jgi:acid phosphatase (class A)
MRRYVLLCLLLTLFLPHAAVAKEDCAQGYVAADLLDPQLLPPPPSEGSAAWRQDLQTVIAAQHSVTTYDLVAIGEEARLTVDYLLRPYGAAYSRAALPAVYALLNRVKLTADCVNDTAKYYWKTRRPFVAAPDLVRLKIAPFQSPSYPSGHTMESRVLAEVLGMLWPDRRAEFRAAAYRIAWHRVQAGAHYPHDLAGGRLQAMQLLGALAANEQFRDELQQARADIDE